MKFLCLFSCISDAVRKNAEKAYVMVGDAQYHLFVKSFALMVINLDYPEDDYRIEMDDDGLEFVLFR